MILMTLINELCRKKNSQGKNFSIETIDKILVNIRNYGSVFVSIKWVQWAQVDSVRKLDVTYSSCDCIFPRRLLFIISKFPKNKTSNTQRNIQITQTLDFFNSILSMSRLCIWLISAVLKLKKKLLIIVLITYIWSWICRLNQRSARSASDNVIKMAYFRQKMQ